MKAQNLFLLLLTLIIFPGMGISQENNDGYGLNGRNSYLGGLGTQDDYISIPHDPVLSQAADGTIEAWVYVTDLSTFNYILTKGNQQSTSAYAFYINTDGRPAIRFGTLNIISNGGTIPLNEWTHVAVSWYDPGDIEINFYINGLKTGSTITTTGSVLTNSSEVRIGVAEFGNEGFGGYIDEVRLWGGHNTEQQIRQNRFVGLGEKAGSNFDGTNFEGCVNYSGLVASWTFNAGLGAWSFEYIGAHHGTKHGNASIQTGVYGDPMPYNNALLFPSGSYNNAVELRDSSAFIPAINPKGTMEVWMRVNQLLGANPVALISKGTTTETSSFYLGLNGSAGKLVFKMGSTTVVSEGPSIPFYSWFHTAVTWNDIGAGYEVKFYINGELNDSLYLNRNSMPANSEPIRIGKSVGFPGDETPRSTYIDELRFWDENLSKDVINKVMFASADALVNYYQNDLMVAWSFDGNMIPSGKFNKMRGTFDIGESNATKFSSYLNESGGAISGMQLFPHNTVMKSNDGVAHSFPIGFYMTAPFDTIPENYVNGITSVINVGPSFPDNNVSNIELFLNSCAPDLNDFEIILTAPNGVSKNVMFHEGGNNANIMTIFSDDADFGINSPGMVAPFAPGVKPNQSFGNFNNSPAKGNWTLNIKRIIASNSGGIIPAILFGWGIRLNGQTVTGIQNVTTELPQKYELSQNYPNPFNPSTSIKFSIPQSGVVSLKVYDILGKEVATLVNSKLNAGVFEYNFNASALSSGIYFYRLDAGSFTEIKKMMLVK